MMIWISTGMELQRSSYISDVEHEVRHTKMLELAQLLQNLIIFDWRIEEELPFSASPFPRKKNVELTNWLATALPILPPDFAAFPSWLSEWNDWLEDSLDPPDRTVFSGNSPRWCAFDEILEAEAIPNAG